MPEAEIERHRQQLAEAAEESALWPDLLPVFRVFSSLSSQWRTSVMPSGSIYWQGIDYGVVPGVLRMMGIARKDWPGLFDDLRVMEHAAAAELNRRKD